MEAELILSVGSNRSREDVSKALNWLAGQLIDFRSSRIYLTPSVPDGVKKYHNAVVKGRINADCEKFNYILKHYEISCGRDSESRKNGIVQIDIDIVIKDGKIIRHRDFGQKFFQIGYLELTGSII